MTTPLTLRCLADTFESLGNTISAKDLRDAADTLERQRLRIDELEEFCRGVATNCTRIAGER